MSGRPFSLWYLFWRKPLVWLAYWFQARDRQMTMQQVIIEAVIRQHHRQP